MKVILNVFAVFDVKAEAYMTPFFVQTKGLAIRSFQGAAEDQACPIAKYPADFALFHLGSFDDRCARFDMLKVPVSLGSAQDFLVGVKEVVVNAPISAPGIMSRVADLLQKKVI